MSQAAGGSAMGRVAYLLRFQVQTQLHQQLLQSNNAASVGSGGARLTWAPAATSALTQSKCPAHAARCSAVRRCVAQTGARRVGW